MSAASSLIPLVLAVCVAAEPSEYFKIKVVDEATGRGVPLVELRTVNNIRYYTDSAGVVAFHEPGLMNRKIFFHVASHGYEFPKDGFGYRGRRLDVVPGSAATLNIKRLNIAERLYRMTGAGIYRDSVLVGDSVPTGEPLLNGLVLGSDSVVNAVYRDKVYWFWGDTNRPSYPLGNFHVPGATSELPSRGGLDPADGVDLTYFVDANGFAKATAEMPGAGPTWINGLVVIEEDEGRPRLFAKYVKVKPPLTVYERGLCEFNDQEQRFEHRVRFDMNAPLIPGGHPFQHNVDGTDYVYFPQPYPLIRVRATAEDLQDPSRYEAYTCFKPGSRQDDLELDRDAQGKPRYDWKPDTQPLTRKLQTQLVRDGKMQPAEGLFQLRDVETEKPVAVHGASVYWNQYRQKWIMIALEAFGTSALGELWYSEAPQPVGPWLHARKIVTHDKYSFYNPKQHPMFDQQGGRIIFFEGTYTAMFSGNPDRTPRYNYNQILYRLDLADPRLKLPETDDRQP